MTLASTQLLLQRLITAPEGVAAALAADADAGGTLRAQLERTVAPSGRLDAVARLEIYANMYFYRLLDVVKADYPATAALLGEAAFHNLITDYLLVHPPSHFSVRYAGQWLPEFLTTHPARSSAPCAAQLAAYERALNDAVDAADAARLTAERLRQLPPAAWAALRLQLHPSVRLLRCDWAVHELRERVERGEPPALAAAAPTYLCTWRREGRVSHRPVDPPEWRALDALAQGASFAEACAAAGAEACAAAGAGVADGEAAALVATALAGWLAAGLIAAPDDWPAA